MTRSYAFRPANLTLLGLLMVPVTLPVGAQLLLEEVTVTATKRNAGLQDVPIALYVMESKQLSQHSIGQLQSLSQFIPNLHISSAGAGDQLFIRGVGSGANFGFEQSVGTFIDGLYFGRGHASRNNFMDVQRVEVLKGPQSTLFGKNTVAGAISIINHQPTDAFEGQLRLTAEPKFNGWSSSLNLSGPLSETIKTRVAIQHSATDGYLNNTFRGEAERQEQDRAARVYLSWQPDDSLELTLKYDLQRARETGRNNRISIASPATRALLLPLDPDFNTANKDQKSSQIISALPTDKQYYHRDQDLLSITANWDIAGHQLTFISGYISVDDEQNNDSDYSVLELANRLRRESHRQLSQEITLTSPSGGRFEYLLGLYYQKEKLNLERFTDLQPSAINMPLPNVGSFGVMQQDSQSLSAFAQLDWAINSELHLIVGARYSQDKKRVSKVQSVTDSFSYETNADLSALYSGALSFSNTHRFDDDGAYTCLGVPGAGAYGFVNECSFDESWNNQLDDEQLTGDITLQWFINPDAMLYAKLSNGYKAGGFDEQNAMGLVDSFSYSDESVISYELGSKLDIAGNRGRLGLAMFYSEYKDLQVSSFDGVVSFVVGNAAKAIVRGVELESRMLITEAVEVNGSIAYLDAFYRDFPGAACNEQQLEALAAASGSRQGCTQDLSGQALQFSPQWNAQLGLDYHTSIDYGLQLLAGINLHYSADQEVSLDQNPLLAQPAYTKVNARLEVAHQHQRWSLALLGKNLTNERTTSFGTKVVLLSSTYAQQISAPRSVELQLSYRF